VLADVKFGQYPLITIDSECLCLSVDKHRIISGHLDGTIRVWDISTNKQIGDPLKGHTDWVRSVAVCDGRIVSGSDDKTIRLWNMSTGKQIGAPLKDIMTR
jgi:WD40 repeat protein